MQDLEDNYPSIFELTTAQEEYSLPDVTHGSETYKTWIMRVTNENLGLNKPEVLFIGGHHGDETVGIEVAYYLAEWLCENYADDPWMHYLVDNREIYIMPVVNPYGWVHLQRYDEHGLDMNRDYPFDESSHVFGTIGARAIHELTDDHLFINTVSWHGGTEMIIYAWGSYAHNSNTECPDDKAFNQQGTYMRDYGGPYSGYYPFGRANDILYPCYGAYEDYAYAMSWDTPNANPNWPSEGCRSLTHCVEISSSKNPSESTLGGRNDLYIPGGSEDGFVPKNIRIALLLTDIAEPYVEYNEDIPSWVSSAEPVTFTWEVKGGFTTSETNILWGDNLNPINNSDYSTTIQSGGTWWDDKVYTQEIIMPTTPGIYYFVIRAKVDQDTLNQVDPEPDINPQSLYVNMRTDDSWSITNNANTLQGHTNWYSDIIEICVGDDLEPPQTTMSIDGDLGNNGWYTGNSKIVLNAEDNLSGVNYTMYRINDDRWKTYSNPFNPGEGHSTIYYYSVDYAGNEENMKTGTIKLDYTKPYTSCNIMGTEGEQEWYNGPVTITLESQDDVSGVDNTFYKIDYEPEWSIYTNPFEISEDGSHIITYYAYDNAGNKEETKEKEFNIDSISPDITLDFPTGGEILNGIIQIRWTANDNLVDPTINIYYHTTSGWKIITEKEGNNGIYNWDTTMAMDGETQIKIIAVDRANNTDTDMSDIVIIDNSLAPYNPDPPNGPTKGKTDVIYTYSASTTDPDGDKLYYNFSWGDGTYSGWLGPYNSGDLAQSDHKWSDQGYYRIKVKAKDTHGEESEWSDPLSTTMPKNKIVNTHLLQFLKDHTHLLPILQILLQMLGL